MKWLQFLWICCKGSWRVSGPDLRNASVKTEAILRALLSKHKFSKWHKTKWLFICFSFMTNKQIKNSCVDIFFYVLIFSRFIAQPCISSTWHVLMLVSLTQVQQILMRKNFTDVVIVGNVANYWSLKVHLFLMCWTRNGHDLF